MWRRVRDEFEAEKVRFSTKKMGILAEYRRSSTVTEHWWAIPQVSIVMNEVMKMRT